MTKISLSMLGKVLATVIIFLVMFVIARPALRLFLCSEESYSPLISPDGRYIATVVEENCGATTGYVAYVDLRQRATGIVGKLVSRAGAHKIGIVGDSARTVRLHWAGKQRLVVEYLGNPPDEISKGQEEWRDITIEYHHPTVQPD